MMQRTIDSAPETARVHQEFSTGHEGLAESPPAERQRKAPPRTRKAENISPPDGFLPRVRVGRLVTVTDWLREYGRVYRSVRRGEISTADGSRLAFMASTGKQLAQAVEELKELKSLREQLERLNGSGAPLRLGPGALIEPAVPSDAVTLDGQS